MALKNIDIRSSGSLDFENWKLMLLMIEFTWLGVLEVYLFFTFEWVYILYEKSSMAMMSNSFDPAGQNASENSSTGRSVVFILYYIT